MIATPKIFLLSPARASGRRYSILTRAEAGFDLAVRLREGAVPVGEIYSFISGLYFRGKLAYAEAFGGAPAGLPSSMVMVPGRGLLPAATPMNLEQLQATSEIAVGESNPVYRNALRDAAKRLEERAGPACNYVLLGSVASAKYTEPLMETFGDRLLFPSEFVGRGDMSRGGLMLRHAESGIELSYVPVRGATLRGTRPPKLEPRRRASSG